MVGLDGRFVVHVAVNTLFFKPILEISSRHHRAEYFAANFHLFTPEGAIWRLAGMIFVVSSEISVWNDRPGGLPGQSRAGESIIQRPFT